MILFLLLLEPSCFGDSALKYMLGNELLPALKAEGELVHTFGEGETPALIPEIEIKEEIEAEISELKPTIAVEVLILYESGNMNLDSTEALLSIYNILRSVSTMKGINYYSASRKRMRTLFTESYVVDSPELKNKLNDPLIQIIPPYSKIYTFQKDLTFGENLYISEYHFGGNYIMVKNQNITTMRYLFLSMVKPKNSRNYLILIPIENQLIFYGLTCLRAFNFLGLEKRRKNSLYNRTKAIYGWFIDRLKN